LIRFLTDGRRRGDTISFLTRFLVSLYLIESGLLLAVAPWMPWWHRNYFAERFPAVQSFILSRTGWLLVITVGSITVLGGIADLYGAFVRRSRQRSAISSSGTNL